MIGSSSSIKGDTIVNPFIPTSYYVGNAQIEDIYSADITVKLLKLE